eukprot:9660257-Lingulodinium_polyedra.AAC.1
MPTWKGAARRGSEPSLDQIHAFHMIGTAMQHGKAKPNRTEATRTGNARNCGAGRGAHYKQERARPVSA